MPDFIQLSDSISLLKSLFAFLISIFFMLLRVQRRIGMPLELETLLLHRHPSLIYCSLAYFSWGLMSLVPLIAPNEPKIIISSTETLLSILNSAVVILFSLQFLHFNQPFWRLIRYAQRFNKHTELTVNFSLALASIYLICEFVTKWIFPNHIIDPLDFADFVITTLALIMLSLGLFEALRDNFRHIAWFAVLLVFAQWLGNGYLIFIDHESTLRLFLLIPVALEAPLILLAVYCVIETNLLD